MFGQAAISGLVRRQKEFVRPEDSVLPGQIWVHVCTPTQV